MEFLLKTAMLLTSIFLILLILIQRGRGGGLAGAFGGLGGQSAFGTKAGDLFTRITIGVAAFWIVLCVASIKLLHTGPGLIGEDAPAAGGARPGATAPVNPTGGGAGTAPTQGTGPALGPASGGTTNPAPATGNPTAPAAGGQSAPSSGGVAPLSGGAPSTPAAPAQPAPEAQK
jgi:preprotein translocase subunit SecG